MNLEHAVPDHAGVDQAERRSSQLFARLHHPATGESERRRLRDEIIECNLPFVTRLAHRYRHRGQDGDDLAQVAAYALVKAVDSFDPARGKPFFGYLAPCVTGELKRHFRDKAWAMHVTRGLQERHLELARHRAALTHRWGRSPTITELADAMGLTDGEVAEALAVGQAYRPDSLNAHTAGEHDSAERQDLLGAEDPGLTSLCDLLALRDLLHQLPDRDRAVVTRYFYQDATQEQIADELGMSQMNVSRLLGRILRDLRRQLEDDVRRPARPSRPGARIVTYSAALRDQVIAVTGDLDDVAAAELRDLLVDTAVRTRPRRVVVDLRGLRAAGGAAARALVDGYRAGGHSGASLVVINIPGSFLDLLGRLGVHRLFPCRPAEPSGPSARARSGRRAALPEQVPSGPAGSSADVPARGTPAAPVAAGPAPARVSAGRSPVAGGGGGPAAAGARGVVVAAGRLLEREAPARRPLRCEPAPFRHRSPAVVRHSAGRVRGECAAGGARRAGGRRKRTGRQSRAP